MKKLLVYFIILIAVAACKEVNSKQSPAPDNKVEAVAEKLPEKNHPDSIKNNGYFFDFDQVVYYKLDISRKDAQAYFDINPRLPEDNEFINIFFSHKPVSVTDTTFISKLEKFGYTKQVIPKKKNKAIRNVFKFNPDAELSELACISYFRDIYVFKKDDKTIGVAKLCYDCEMSHFVGANLETAGFGKNGEFQELSKIVK